MRQRKILNAKVLAQFQRYDAIVYPNGSTVALPIALPFNKSYPDFPGGPDMGSPGNLAGLPAIALPNGFGEHGLPAGATEEYVQVTDYGPSGSSSACNGAGGSYATVTYYTILLHGSGTATLPSHAGPGGAQSYPASLHDPKPPIRGHSNQDDVSISAASCLVAPGGQGLAPACPAGTLPLPGQPQ